MGGTRGTAGHGVGCQAGRTALVAVVATALLGGCGGGSDPPGGPTSAGNSARTTDPATSDATTTEASPSATRTSAGLDSYTDPGDGCAQAISAIGYTEESLLPLGQEPYQEFDDVVRSKLSEVAGTLSLEAKDWPNKAVYRQAKVLIPLAEQAALSVPVKNEARARARIRILLEYRVQAARLVQLCRYPARP